ncbi:hypothetical protein M404DRAFT_1005268 [Pisolithus tinctorius Marx 270]|uniref:Uncharacterized protein n=1 Tax=Pisolithus tinctorius Marx 270 TaxID=870435 RepID=A0A0C3NTL8_PISTI|nr:hypothetical protein M404DRAFT_1005268 [Pisolithus tinctorius Marx 270]
MTSHTACSACGSLAIAIHSLSTRHYVDHDFKYGEKITFHCTSGRRIQGHRSYSRYEVNGKLHTSLRRGVYLASCSSSQ